MNILETIMDKILPHHKANAQNPGSAGQGSVAATPNLSQPGGIGVHPSAGGVQAMNSGAPHVDVEQVLSGMEHNNTQRLDWRNSIVDLMKMLGMQSDLNSRKQLARELKYSGDVNDTAKMNAWLHQQVMLKLEENGGKIPDSMKH